MCKTHTAQIGYDGKVCENKKKKKIEKCFM